MKTTRFYSQFVFLTFAACGFNGVAAQTADPAFDRIDGLHGLSQLTGTQGMRFITPDILEIARTGTKDKDIDPTSWNFVPAGVFTPPDPASYSVTLNGQATTATFLGLRRRVAHAPLIKFDIHIDNRVFIRLPTAAQTGDVVNVTTDGWGTGSSTDYTATFTPDRRNPAIHVNQVGYASIGPKQAMVGYYLGSGGELIVPASAFRIIDITTGASVFSGVLTPRAESGFGSTPLPYQKVMAADFSALEISGTYQLEVDGLGRSLSFLLNPDMNLNFARMYAQGLYNQRCGSELKLPYTRHTHWACHTAMADIPTGAAEYQDTWNFIAAANNGSTTVNRMVSVDTQLYPIIRTGKIDVSGGHHDAGDYSKYTINSAQLIHHLVFAADNFPGAGSLDNLGIPESGDGKSDLLQEAKIEADYLAKLQDDDGGFFFLVYPKHRKYESDVLPDAGDAQVVWPKNTAATAAAVAALADIGSSPLFKQQFPAESAIYLQKARLGWNFLMSAIQAHGKAGSYQKITHYGDLFTHDDELAWAAASMFAATGDPTYQQKFIEWYVPQAPETVRWGWWYLFEGYGCAARSYSFAVSSGRRVLADMDATQLAKTQAIIKTAGDAIATRVQRSAYGTPLDDASKRMMTAGWFFSGDRAFDITTRNAQETRSDWKNLLLACANYELGCNPLNVSFVTGAGQHQQHEIVHQYAQNDMREMPPSGFPLGNLQAGFAWTAMYKSNLSQMNYPFDWGSSNQYPLYDRWGDTYNTTTEFVVAQQARELASMCALAASAPGANSPWQTASAQIFCPSGFLPQNQPVTFQLQCGSLDLTNARVTWETPDECHICDGPSIQMTPTKTGTIWVEAEAVLPDGKRFSVRKEVGVHATSGANEFPLQTQTVALYHFNGDFNDSSPNALNLTMSGNVTFDPLATGWMNNPSGSAVHFHGIGDTLTVTIPDSKIEPGNTASALTLEAWINPLAYNNHGKSNDPIFNLYQTWDSQLGIQQDMWIQPCCPFIKADSLTLLDNNGWGNLIQIGTWQLLSISRDVNGIYTVAINGRSIPCTTQTTNSYGKTNDWTLTLGNFDGYIDEVRITGSGSASGTGTGTTASGTSGTGTSSNSGTTTTGLLPTATTVQPFARAFVADATTVALYHFDGDFLDYSGNHFDLTASPGVSFVPTYVDSLPVGQAARFRNLGDTLTTIIPDAWIAPGNSSQELTLEAWIFPRAYKAYGQGADLLRLTQYWDSSLGVSQDKWGKAPMIMSGSTTIVNSLWTSAVTLGQWQKLTITRNAAGYVTFQVNDNVVANVLAPNNYGRTNGWLLTLGNIDADIDELRISRTIHPAPAPEGFINDYNTIALYHFDGNFQDSSGNNLNLNPGGNTALIANPSWMIHPYGASAAFSNLGDNLTVTIPNSVISPGPDVGDICIEARILPTAFLAQGHSAVNILRLYQSDDNSLGFIQDSVSIPAAPMMLAGNSPVYPNTAWDTDITPGEWHTLKLIRYASNFVSLEVDGTLLVYTATQTTQTAQTYNWQLELGNFIGEIDELRISNIPR